MNDLNELSDMNFQWVTPLIEGVPPSPRGGHTATKVGRFIVIFGVLLIRDIIFLVNSKVFDI